VPRTQALIDESQASSSAEVEQRILQAGQSQASLSDAKISVTATAGAVALDGVVADERQHQTALGVARLNAGGRRIVDHIKSSTGSNSELEVGMKIKEVMSENPVCCLPSDSAQSVAKMMCDRNIGSIPVVNDQQSKQLLGVITDRDLCCAVIAGGLDPKTTPIQKFVTANPVTCRDGENIDKCEQLMQERQVRRVPVVDDKNSVIGIVSQADLALKGKPERLSKTVAEISKPRRSSAAA